MKTIAIMQPYVFPYLGYFQLMNLVDVFVVYEDVNFIKRGWINRNRLLNTEFSMPLQDVSQNRLIKDTLLHETYGAWREKFLKTLRHTYAKAEYFAQGFNLAKDVIYARDPGQPISELCNDAFAKINAYLDISSELKSSTIYDNRRLKAQDRIIDICQKEKADRYVNLIGGKDLYTTSDFQRVGIELCFHKVTEHQYKQFDKNFQPYLSILDVLMFCSVDEIKSLLLKYDLVK